MYHLGCLDLLFPAVYHSTVEQWKNWRPPVNSTGTLPLPPEVVLLILEYLPSETLINFFCTSAANLTFAPLYCRLHRWHLFPSIDLGSTRRDIQEAIDAVGRTFSSDQYLALDNNRRLSSLMGSLPDPLPAIPNSSITTTWNMWDTSQEAPPAYGLKHRVANIPDDVVTAEIYTRFIRDDFYVCGIEWSSASGESLVGSASGRKTSISFTKATLYFIADPLGIKLMKFGESPWKPKKPPGDVRSLS